MTKLNSIENVAGWSIMDIENIYSMARVFTLRWDVCYDRYIDELKMFS